MSKFKLACAALATLIFVFASHSRAVAQTTLFNIPSTDVQGKGRLYTETDFIAHFDKYDNGGFQTLGLRGVYGLGKNLEVGANTYFTRSGASELPIEIQPNFKYQAYSNEKHGVAVAGGAMFFVPVRNRANGDFSTMTYATASKKVKEINGARFTGGAYTMLGAKQANGTKTGTILAYEQPLAKRLTFTIDYFSGKNRVGYASASLAVTLSPNSVIYAGYNFGNGGRGNNSFMIYHGYTF